MEFGFYGDLRADCLYTGISSGHNARYRVWEAFTFTFLLSTICLHANRKAYATYLNCRIWKPNDFSRSQVITCTVKVATADMKWYIWSLHISVGPIQSRHFWWLWLWLIAGLLKCDFLYNCAAVDTSRGLCAVGELRVSTRSDLAVWSSGNGVGHLNEVVLRRLRLVLGWPFAGIPSLYITSHSGQLSLRPSAGREVRLGRYPRWASLLYSITRVRCICMRLVMFVLFCIFRSCDEIAIFWSLRRPGDVDVDTAWVSATSLRYSWLPLRGIQTRHSQHSLSLCIIQTPCSCTRSTVRRMGNGFDWRMEKRLRPDSARNLSRDVSCNAWPAISFRRLCR